MAELYLFNDNGNYFPFTPSIFPKTFGGREYKPALVVRQKLNITDNFSKAPLTFRFERNNPFARKVLGSVPEKPILVTVYKDGNTYWLGRVSKSKGSGNTIDLICESIFAGQVRSGQALTISPLCIHVVYTPKCGVLKENWVSPYANVTIVGNNLTIPSMTEADGYFSNGMAEFNGETRTIVRHEGTTITFSSPFLSEINTGTIYLYPGCDLTSENCTAFGNLVNRLAFDHLPSKNPFGSSGLL